MAEYDWVADTFFGPLPAVPQEGSAEDPAAKAPAVKPEVPRIFVAFDLETTGLDSRLERIVEIGAVKFDCRGIIARYGVLVNPGKPMPAEASKVNGITDEMLADKPSLDQVLPDFLRFINGAILVAHNAPFDVGFVNAALASRFGKQQKARTIDLAQASLLDDPLPEAEATPSWAVPFASLPNRVVDTKNYAKEAFPGRWKYNLQILAQFLNLNAIDAHRAEDDARVCMDLFVKCAEKQRGLEVKTFETNPPSGPS